FGALRLGARLRLVGGNEVRGRHLPRRRGGRDQRHAEGADQVVALAVAGLGAVQHDLAGGNRAGEGIQTRNLEVHAQAELRARGLQLAGLELGGDVRKRRVAGAGEGLAERPVAETGAVVVFHDAPADVLGTRAANDRIRREVLLLQAGVGGNDLERRARRVLALQREIAVLIGLRGLRYREHLACRRPHDDHHRLTIRPGVYGSLGGVLHLLGEADLHRRGFLRLVLLELRDLVALGGGDDDLPPVGALQLLADDRVHAA